MIKFGIYSLIFTIGTYYYIELNKELDEIRQTNAIWKEVSESLKSANQEPSDNSYESAQRYCSGTGGVLVGNSCFRP